MANGGIYFHTQYQETSWPKTGFESQVNVTQGDWIKTGSLYGIVNSGLTPAKDNQWWTQHIIVSDSAYENLGQFVLGRPDADPMR